MKIRLEQSALNISKLTDGRNEKARRVALHEKLLLDILFTASSQEITWSGNMGRKTPISFNLRKYVEKHSSGP